MTVDHARALISLVVLAVFRSWPPDLRADQPSKADTQATLFGFMEHYMATCTEANTWKLLSLARAEMHSQQLAVPKPEAKRFLKTSHHSMLCHAIANATKRGPT
jgi:hypothetical protein